MSSVVQVGTTIAGGIIGFVVSGGNPVGALRGASIGYSAGAYLSGSSAAENSPTYSLGGMDLTRSHRLPVPVVYGEHQVAGNIVYEDVHGEDKQLLDAQIAISEGPIEAINDIQANKIELDSSDYTIKLGERDQSAWSKNTDDHFPYTAYIAVELDAEELELSGIPTVTSIVKGRKVRVWNGSSFNKEYSNNPAWCLMDFLTNRRYGLGLADDDIDIDSFKSVADWCDTNDYTLNYVIDSKQSSLDILETMLRAFNSFLIYTGGQIALKADTVENEVVQTFDMSNIIAESFSYEGSKAKDIPNKITIEYPSPDKNYEMVEAYYSNDQDIQQRNEINNQPVQLLGVTNFDQAGRIARKLYNEMYFSRTFCQFSAGIDSIHCQPGDVIEVSHELPNWDTKEFRVMKISEEENDTMTLVCKEYDANIYNDEGVVYQPPTGPELPNPYDRPPTVNNLEVAEKGNANLTGDHIAIINVEWDNPDSPFFNGTEVWLKFDNRWDKAATTNRNQTYKEIEVSFSGEYEVKVISVNRQGRKSEFDLSPSQTILIEGKTEKPTKVEWDEIYWGADYIKLTWNPHPDDDFDEYEVRLDNNFGNNY